MTHREQNRPHIVDRDARDTTDAVLRWAQRSAEPPWFIWVHFQDPHGPYTAPGADPARDEPTDPKLRVLTNEGGLGGIPAYQALPGLYTAGGYERAYLAEIAFLDPSVERLVAELDALGDPPAVLLTADHGEAFGEDGFYFAHGHSVGLDQVRVPLLWRPPHPIDPVTVVTPVSLLDAAPTLLRAAGLEPPAEFRGRALPVADGNAADTDPARAIFAEHGWHAAIIVGSAYYARGRRAVPQDARDPTSGGPVAPLPRRTARLSGVGPLPAYEIAGGEVARALEPLLAEHLASSEVRAAPQRASVPPETRERLRALGYLD
jgi:arylsulfatase